MLWFLIFLPAIAIPLWVRYHHPDTFDWKEVAITITVGFVLSIFLYNVSIWDKTSDVELLNGTVTGKEQVRVSCSHSYQCNCRTVTSGSGNSRTTSTVCDTCYEHWNDYDWNVDSTVGTFTIDRVDRQGVDEPERWSIVQNGQPVTLPHHYTNYVKGSPESLFNIKPQGDPKTVPQYPRVFDYHYANRVIPVGIRIPSIDRWNAEFAEMNARIGPAHHGNVVMIITTNDRPYGDLVEQTWIGGKKNDIVIIAGVDRFLNTKWVKVFSWSRNDMINVHLRNALTNRRLEPSDTVRIIQDSVEEYYDRRPMAEFKYLSENIEPDGFWVTVMTILMIIVAGGITLVFHNRNW